MFHTKKRWGYQTLKAIFIAGIMYRCARFFMKMTEKQYKEKKKRPDSSKKRFA